MKFRARRRFAISLLVQQLRCQCYVVRCNIPELQFFKKVFPVKLVGKLIRRLPVQVLPGGIVYMVGRFPHVPLRQVREYRAFGDDHPEHRVDVFYPAFLVAPHGVTVVDRRPSVPVPVSFKRIGVAELAASVRIYGKVWTNSMLPPRDLCSCSKTSRTAPSVHRGIRCARRSSISGK